MLFETLTEDEKKIIFEPVLKETERTDHRPSPYTIRYLLENLSEKVKH